jgi:hypothetical protein
MLLPSAQVHFDTREGAQYSAGGQQVSLPSVLFCTEDGALCRVSAADSAAAVAAASSSQSQPYGRMEELTWQGRQAARRAPQALAQLPAAINSFDLGGPFGTDVVAVTARQTIMYMQTAP